MWMFERSLQLVIVKFCRVFLYDPRWLNVEV